MRKSIVIFYQSFRFFVLLTLWTSRLEAHSSLFFTSDEMNAINKKENKDKGLTQSLSLSSILYLDESHWTVWINGKRLHPENPYVLKTIRIEKVTEHQVTITCKDQDEILTLLPNQTVTVSQR